MLSFRLRRQVLERLAKRASFAGELGLALLMTAGVSYCGGTTDGNGGGGTRDAAPDHAGPWIEAAQGDSGVIVEAAWDGSIVTEAAVFPDAGSDGSISPLPEACCVEAAWGPDGSPWVEAAHGDSGGSADAGSDASIGDAGSDGSPHPLPEAPMP